MDVSKIARKIENCIIEECQIVYGEDTLILTLAAPNGDVFTLEIIVDSIYLEED
jgi:hypothetical protein